MVRRALFSIASIALSFCGNHSSRAGQDVDIPKDIPEKYQLLERQAPADRKGDLAALRDLGKREGWTFKVGYTSAFQKKSINSLAGTKIPQNFLALAIAQNGLAAKANGAADLSAKLAGVPVPEYLDGCDPNKPSFDWKSTLPPIRNQGDCGDCWAFSAAAAYEGAYSIREKPKNVSLFRLSEQAVLDCARGDDGNRAGSCSGGWYYPAFQWMIWNGAAPSESLPYKARDGVCPAGLDSKFKAVSWGFVSSRQEIPLTKNIKQAICRYGPISSAIVATDAFSAYIGGVFNEPENETDNLVNHAVSIVGWDDNADGSGQGAWLVRNSWGEDWGDMGYGYVAYRTNKIGYASAWVRPLDSRSDSADLQRALQSATQASKASIKSAELLASQVGIDPPASDLRWAGPNKTHAKSAQSNKTVWLQYSTEASKNAANRVSEALLRDGYFAPIEDVSTKSISAPRKAQVRYFDPLKFNEAKTIAQKLVELGYDNVETVIPNGFPRLQTLEVWLPNGQN